mmetsp:Transcript_71936/g.83593  ORF Transcript_71936/g.83593 Transcript_71936/m.83593 type:complete len:107 (-) Transcript_71936:181-501(-)
MSDLQRKASLAGRNLRHINTETIQGNVFEKKIMKMLTLRVRKCSKSKLNEAFDSFKKRFFSYDQKYISQTLLKSWKHLSSLIRSSKASIFIKFVMSGIWKMTASPY